MSKMELYESQGRKMAVDIRGAITQGLDTIFSQLTQIVEDFTLERKTDGTYNPQSGSVEGVSTSTHNFSGLLFDIKDVPGRFGGTDTESDALEIGDKKLLVRKSDMDADLAGFITRGELSVENLSITREKDSTKWQVVRFKEDPTRTLSTITIRRAK